MTGRRLHFDHGLALCAAFTLLGCGPDTVAETASTSTTSSSTGAETSETTAEGEPSCEPVLQADGSPSGLVTCSNEATFRVSPETCTDPFPPNNTSQCNLMYGTCEGPEDCVGQPYGSCQAFGDINIMCSCVYGCTSDAECEADEACLCSPLQAGTVCVDATCRTDADCPGDLRCGLSLGLGGPTAGIPTPTLRCRTPQDTCAGDLDCEEGICRFSGDAWSCSG